MRMTFVLSVLMILASSHTTRARIINIPVQLPTIQAGIDSALTGDTVLVAPGLYQENVHFRGRDIVLASQFLISPVDSFIVNTIIDGGDSGSVIRMDSAESRATTIEGFTIQNGNSRDIGGGIYCNGTSPIIYHNIISNNIACTGGGVGCISRANPVIDRNIISHNGTNSCNGGGISCDDTSDAIITNNILYRNYAYE